MTAPGRLSRAPILLLLAPLLAVVGCGSAEIEDATPLGAAAVEENRLEREVIVEALDEPMVLEFGPEGRVYVAQRKGAIRRIDPETGRTETVGRLSVFAGEDGRGETGLVGMLLGRRFAETGHLYVYYSAPLGASPALKTTPGPGSPRHREYLMRLSRFTVGPDGTLSRESEVVMLEWPYVPASHMGGGMVWDADGNLYLSTGDDTDATQYAPLIWSRPGGWGEDARRSAGNTNDLRGKILRIHPEPDGSYRIPDGNLFEPGTPRTRPEIYAMGNRNPWRLSVDPETGYLHWGEVGPDAGRDSAGVGPMGYDEFNVARSAGNFGWPFGIGYGRPYHRWDRESGSYGEAYDLAAPVNRSPNSTGLDTLPPARSAVLAYPYGVSEEYPILSSGGRNAVGGPVYRTAEWGPGAEYRFPAAWDGRWFVGDFVRNWILMLTLDEARTDVVAIERLMPEERFYSIIDLEFGPDGALYVLEYGTEWFAHNPDSRLSRVVYRRGNRPPRARISADPLASAAPVTVRLFSAGTFDPDGDAITFRWTVRREGGPVVAHPEGAEAELTLREPGAYRARLTASDPEGLLDSASVVLVAGNEPPSVRIELTEGNRSFHFPGETHRYAVRVNDSEDGSLREGTIPGERVRVTLERVSGGIDPGGAREAAIRLGPDESLRHLEARRLIEAGDCGSCHAVASASAGPSFRTVARRYDDGTGPGDAARDAVDYLAEKIVDGGRGVWGAATMPAHPSLSAAESRTIARYVLSLDDSTSGVRRISASGRLELERGGTYVLRAGYTDRGAPNADPLSDRAVHVLRPPELAPQEADTLSEGISYTPSRDPGFIVERSGAFLGVRDLDLSGIERLRIDALTRFYNWSHFVGGDVEVRLGSPRGRRIGGPVSRRPPEDLAPGAPVLGGDLEDPLSVELAETSGTHDLFLVFTHPDASVQEPLLLLRAVHFER